MMRIGRLGLALAASLLLASCNEKRSVEPQTLVERACPVPSSSGPLRVQGDKIVNTKTGQEVWLTGVQLVDLEASETVTYPTMAQLRQIRSWGVNTVVMTTYWTAPESGFEIDEMMPGVYRTEVLEFARKVARMAADAGLYVMMQLRVDVFDDAPWDGWSSHDYVNFNETDRAGQRGTERYAKFIKWISYTLVETEPNIIGVEVWHFPYHASGGRAVVNDQKKMNSYFSNVVPKIVTAARAGTNKIIFLSGPTLGGFDYNKHPGPVSDDNVVYTTGGYGQVWKALADRREAWDGKSFQDPDPSFIAFKRRHHVPVMSTEGPGIAEKDFLAKYGSIPQDAKDMFTTVFDIFNTNANGWIIHTYGCFARMSVTKACGTGPKSEGFIVQEIKKRARPLSTGYSP